MCVLAIALAAIPTTAADAVVYTTSGAGTYTIPAGVTKLEVEAIGAGGGKASNQGTGGSGCKVTTVITVTPGSTISYFVGSKGSAAGSDQQGGGGGGGGSTSITYGSTKFIAGGGGGGGWSGPGGNGCSSGGAAGGSATLSSGGSLPFVGAGGAGGTGGAGAAGNGGTSVPGQRGGDGDGGYGGNGSFDTNVAGVGGVGSGAVAANQGGYGASAQLMANARGGGGGGGYGGGGSGGSGQASGGGGAGGSLGTSDSTYGTASNSGDDGEVGIRLLQTVTFTVTPTVPVGGTGTIVATSSGDGTVRYTSRTPQQCTVNVNSGIVTGIKAGTDNCTIRATALRTDDYAVSYAEQAFSIGLGTPTLTFNPVTPTIRVATPATVRATSASSGAVSFSTTSTDCTVVQAGANATVTGTRVGTNNCMIVAEQAATSDYHEASGSVTVSVGQGPQTVTFGPVPTVSIGGPAAVSATSTGGGAITYSTVSPACTVDSNSGLVTGTVVGSNNCAIVATAAATTNYLQGTRTQTLSISVGVQTVMFGSGPNVMIDAPATVSATGSAGGTISYATSSADCSVDSFSGLVTGINAGVDNCTVTATAAANSDYGIGTGQQVLSIGKGSQTVTFGGAPVVVMGAPAAVSATASAGGVIAYSTASTGCSVDANSGLVSGVAAGADNCVVTATAAATANYGEGTASQTLSIGVGTQVVSFGTPPVVTMSASAAVSATSTGDGAIGYSTVSTGCSVDADTGVVTGMSAGVNNCVITATASATGNYTQATQEQTLSVGIGSQVVSFGPAPTISMGSPAAVSATTTGDGSISYSTTATDCSVDSGTGLVTPLSAGTDNCMITAIAQATSNYTQGSASQTLSILLPTQAVTFDPAPAVAIGAPGSVHAETTGDGAISYSTSSPDCSVAPGSGLVTGIATGTDNCVVTATAAQTANYSQGVATQTLSIARGSQTVTFGAAPVVVMGAPAAVSATSTGDGSISYSTVSLSCSVDSSTGLVTGIAVGTDNCEIIATAASTSTYQQGISTQTISIGIRSQTVTFGPAPTVVMGIPSAVSASSSGDGAVSYSTTSVDCSVDASTGLVTGVVAGVSNCDILATATATTNFTQGVGSQTLSVGVGSQTVTFGPAPVVLMGTPVAVAATTDGDGGIAYSTNSPGCAVGEDDGLVTGQAAGTNNCVIVASAAATGNYTSATASQTLSIGVGDQVVSFGPAPDVSMTSGGTVTSSTTGDGAITYSSLTPSVCVVDPSSGQVAGVSVGDCTIEAAASATGNYTSATAQQSFAVTAGAAPPDAVTISLAVSPAQIIPGQEVLAEITAAAGISRSDGERVNGTAVVTVKGAYLCTAPIVAGRGACVGKISGRGKLTFEATFTGTVAGFRGVASAQATTTVTSRAIVIDSATVRLQNVCRPLATATVSGRSIATGSAVRIYVKTKRGWKQVAKTRTGANTRWKAARFKVPFTSSKVTLRAKSKNAVSAPVKVKITGPTKRAC